MAKLSYFRITVSGGGEFPVDMLRRDECYPNGESDSYAIQHMSDFRTIVLFKASSNPWWTPTGGRWESFGWKVEGVEVVK
jgi:hypothetical protein